MTSAASDLALNRLREHREAICEVLARYGASNPGCSGRSRKVTQALTVMSTYC
jgi:hypothetical protein